MKRKKTLLISILSILSILVNAQIYFTEGFENNGLQIPEGWTQEDVGTSHGAEWVVQTGGFFGNPPNAHSGTYNAMFQYQSPQNEATLLLPPPINIEGAISPQLSFYHVQRLWPSWGNDELRVLYKNHLDSNWIELANYTDSISNWKKQIINLPNPNSTYYLAFEGTTRHGLGTCIDDIEIVETAVIQKTVKQIVYSQPTTDFVYNSQKNNHIFKIEITAFGNTGSLFINSIKGASQNSNDDDISEYGIKLYRTESDVFENPLLIDSVEGFVSGEVNFENINYDLPNGKTYFWITYDIDSLATNNNLVDLSIPVNGINIHDTLYPNVEQNPNGSRTIYTAVFADNFENQNIGWALSGEFEIDSVRGLGGSSLGNPDPSAAKSGKYILGTDITGLGSKIGDYELSLNYLQDSAVSPEINAYYYKNCYLRFYRVLNAEHVDRSYIHITTNDTVWSQIWESNNLFYTIENQWNLKEYNLSEFIDRDSTLKIRFGLGPTDGLRVLSGWNIDEFVITGDPINYDPASMEISSPYTSCGHGFEPVTVKIKNFGLKDLTQPIPIAYSIDNGATLVYDTIITPIPFGDSIEFTFSEPVDVSVPDFYNEFIVFTDLDEDDYIQNDTAKTEFYSIPTYSLPYTENFDGGLDFWLPYGENASWEKGIPSTTIIASAYTEPNCWITGLDTFYNDNEVSYLESPCFDMTSADYSMFECMIHFETEKNVDGAALQYSINGGLNWDTIGVESDRWNWHNSSSITSLNNTFGNPTGWTDTSGNWIHVAHLLPDTLRYCSDAKFRFVFASNDLENEYYGFALDDVVVRETPPDVAIVDILAPDSACELSHNEQITVAIKNYGLDTINAGSAIPVGVFMNDVPQFYQNLIIPEDILSGDTMHITLGSTLDIWSAGDYFLKAFTYLSTDENLFSNGMDTAFKQIAVFGMPDYTLGEDIATTQIDTVILDAGAGYVSYVWSNDSTNRFLQPDTTGIYSVTVTNSMGCTASDTIIVVYSSKDVGITELSGIEDDCEHEAPIFPAITIKNFGLDTVYVDDTIYAGILINEQLEVYEPIIITQDLPRDSSFSYTYVNPIDLSDVGTNEVKAFTSMVDDILLFNDSIWQEFNTWGFPEISLGEDIITTQPDTVVLTPGLGFSTYLWQDGSANSTFNVTYPASASYSVTITDEHGCPDSDSVDIYTWDLGVTALIHPTDACALSNAENITMQISNYSLDTIDAGLQIEAMYAIDEGDEITEIFTLQEILFPDSSVNFTFASTEDFSEIGIYEVNLDMWMENEADTTNNTFETEIEVFGATAVDLGPDTIFSTQPDSIILDPGEGYFSYLWQDGSDNQTFEVTALNSAMYYVTVTDENVCPGSDSIYIFSHDMAMELITAPESDCELTNEEILSISFINHGYDTLPIGHTQEIGYQINSNDFITESIILNEELTHNESIDYSFTQTIDMQEDGGYEIKVFMIGIDANINNDTLNQIVSNFVDPVVDLGYDTILTYQPDTVFLDAGAGFASYQWNFGFNTQIIQIPGYGMYWVIVEDENGCTATDTTYVLPGDNVIELAHNLLIKVYPNPVRDKLNIEFDVKNSTKLIVSILDEYSKIMSQETIDVRNGLKKSIDFSQWSAGVYHLVLQSKESTKTIKVIKN